MSTEILLFLVKVGMWISLGLFLFFSSHALAQAFDRDVVEVLISALVWTLSLHIVFGRHRN